MHGNKNKRFTASLAISSNGNKLKPFLIFNGKRDGRIATRELTQSEFRHVSVLVCQDSAWQDEVNMLGWIDSVLVPYLQEKAEGEPCVILLDKFSVHWTPTVMERLRDLGVTGHQIPGGCTHLCQPFDVGIAKPLKDCYRRK